jgi:hypothetical protein
MTKRASCVIEALFVFIVFENLFNYARSCSIDNEKSYFPVDM